MSFDGITTRALVSELQRLVGARINRINQPESLDLVFVVHKDKTERLLLSAGNNAPRFHLISDAPKNPLTPPNFCMILRKHIQGGIIKSITQHTLDRVVRIEISSYDDMGYPCIKTIIIEIMGRHSNIILLDGETVIDSIKRVTLDMSRVRQILPGMKYVMIEDDKNNLLESDVLPSEIFDFSKSAQAFKSFYMNYTGLSPLISREIMYKTGLEVDIRLNILSDEDISSLDKAFIEVREMIRNNTYSPTLILSLESEKPVGFYPFEIIHLGDSNIKKDTMSELLDVYYSYTDTSDRLIQMSSNILKSINNRLKRLQNKYVEQKNELDIAKQREKLKVYADLISANIHNIDRGVESVDLNNFYSESMETINIPLDVKLNPVQNAQNYYKKYSKLKKTEEVLSRELPKLTNEIEYLRQVQLTLDSVSEIEELDEIREELMQGGYIKARKSKTKKKTKQSSKPLSFLTSDGLEVLVGKNNRQNDELTLRTAQRSDIFLHAQKVPGAHVILRTQNKDVSDKSIYQAAYLAAKYSSLKNESHVMIDYTEKKNVNKPKGAKPGMVYYNNFESILIDLTDKSISDNIKENKSTD